jgi:hypothetical protein
MNTKASFALAGAVALAALLGCSTPKPVAPAQALPAMTVYELPYGLPETPGSNRLPGLCKLGSSCLAMDPRPFEACLLSTKSCRDKPIQVGQPEWSAPPPAIIETSR